MWEKIIITLIIEFSERKHQTLVYSSTISQLIQCIVSYLLPEISAYCESISRSSELVPFLLQSFQIRWLFLTPNRAYSEISFKRFCITNFYLSLIMQFHKVLISTLFQTSVKNLWHGQCRERSSVSQTYSGNIINTERYWIVQYFRKYFTLLELYFHMDYEVPKVKGMSNSRFGSIIFLLRLAGIPFKMKNMSTLYAIYMITVISCTCTTFVGMLVDVYINRDDMGHTITNIPVSIGFTNVLWMFFYCR
jgi:hypothetical protein